MKLSQRLRGRASAFRLDRAEVSRKLDGWDGESEHVRRDLLDRLGGYKVAADELSILADEYEREGM